MKDDMETRITILCDNSINRSGFVGEHGFSCLIERGAEKYLFDTGPGMSLPINLKTLKMVLKGLNFQPMRTATSISITASLLKGTNYRAINIDGIMAGSGGVCPGPMRSIPSSSTPLT